MDVVFRVKLGKWALKRMCMIISLAVDITRMSMNKDI